MTTLSLIINVAVFHIAQFGRRYTLYTVFALAFLPPLRCFCATSSPYNNAFRRSYFCELATPTIATSLDPSLPNMQLSQGAFLEVRFLGSRPIVSLYDGHRVRDFTLDRRVLYTPYLIPLRDTLVLLSQSSTGEQKRDAIACLVALLRFARIAEVADIESFDAPIITVLSSLLPSLDDEFAISVIETFSSHTKESQSSILPAVRRIADKTLSPRLYRSSAYFLAEHANDDYTLSRLLQDLGSRARSDTASQVLAIAISDIRRPTFRQRSVDFGLATATSHSDPETRYIYADFAAKHAITGPVVIPTSTIRTLWTSTDPGVVFATLPLLVACPGTASPELELLLNTKHKALLDDISFRTRLEVCCTLKSGGVNQTLLNLLANEKHADRCQCVDNVISTLMWFHPNHFIDNVKWSRDEENMLRRSCRELFKQNTTASKRSAVELLRRAHVIADQELAANVINVLLSDDAWLIDDAASYLVYLTELKTQEADKIKNNVRLVLTRNFVSATLARKHLPSLCKLLMKSWVLSESRDAVVDNKDTAVRHSAACCLLLEDTSLSQKLCRDRVDAVRYASFSNLSHVYFGFNEVNRIAAENACSLLELAIADESTAVSSIALRGLAKSPPWISSSLSEILDTHRKRLMVTGKISPNASIRAAVAKNSLSVCPMGSGLVWAMADESPVVQQAALQACESAVESERVTDPWCSDMMTRILHRAVDASSELEAEMFATSACLARVDERASGFCFSLLNKLEVSTSRYPIRTAAAVALLNSHQMLSGRDSVSILTALSKCEFFAAGFELLPWLTVSLNHKSTSAGATKLIREFLESYRTGVAPAMTEIWPPPPWTTSHSVAARETGETLGDVYSKLRKRLDSSGYTDGVYYGGGSDGFAIVTRAERMEVDGSSADTDRWKVRIADMHKLSVSSWLESLFTASPGRYRVFLIAVTMSPLDLASNRGVTVVLNGNYQLPPHLSDDVASLKSQSYTIWYVIYILARSPDGTMRLVEAKESPITGIQHLQKAGLK